MRSHWRPETVYLEQVEWVEREGITPFEYVMAADVSPSVEARVLEPNLQVVDLDGDQLPEMVLLESTKFSGMRGKAVSDVGFCSPSSRKFATRSFRGIFWRYPYGLHGNERRGTFLS